MTDVHLKAEAPAKKIKIRGYIVMEYSEYAKDRAKYLAMTSARRRLMVLDDQGQVVLVAGGRL